jgi:hypothetical protein
MSHSVETDISEVHYDPECTPEQIVQVLSALDRWSGRTAKHVMHQRKSDRHNYRTSVIIEAGEERSGTAGLRKIFHVSTRNVSKAGLGFVAPPIFMPRVLSDRTLLVRTEAMFRVGTQVKVKLGSADGKMPTLGGVVMRLRPIHFGFFDVGVRFVAREP